MIQQTNLCRNQWAQVRWFQSRVLVCISMVLGPVLFTRFLQGLLMTSLPLCQVLILCLQMIQRLFAMWDILMITLHFKKTWTCFTNGWFNGNWSLMYWNASISIFGPNYMNGVAIDSVESLKDLSILLDHQLKFHSHTINIATKTNQLFGLIKRSFEHLD